MNSAYSDMWLVVKWFFTDFLITIITMPLGILKDTLDMIGISWKIVCLIAAIAGIIAKLIIRYIKRML